jgi:murein DD-endopeptidase MepM/ murein hydrolase activator NlpD
MINNPLLPRPTALRLTLLAVALALLAIAPLLRAPPPAPASPAGIAQEEPQDIRPSISYESVTITAGDSLARVLLKRGHDASTVQQIVESGSGGSELANLKANTTLTIGVDPTGQLREISYAPDLLREVRVQRNEGGLFESSVTEKPTVSVTRYADGVIEDSLFASGKRAGVSDTTILELADAFSYDIDFALEVQPGDSFKVIYEEVLVEDTKIGEGPVLAAEFTNQGKTYRAVRFVSAGGRAGFYTPEGMAMRKAFLRTPVDFARISSRYTNRRLHPVLNTVRAHRGVDYAAARGTPVRATGDGKIEFAGNKGGYGRVLIIRHHGSQSTLYAHLNGFAKNIRSGARVAQGQIIGYVGSTGLASGPHLHYEFRVNGVHVDPLKVKTTQAVSIAAAEKAAFLSESSRLVAMLDGRGGKTAVAQAPNPPGSVSARQL